MADVPMTEAEINRLETLLEEPPAGAEPLWLDSLQGFIAAVVSAPKPVERARWLEIALGADRDWDADADAAELVRLVDRLREDVLRDLVEGEGLPLLLYPTDESGEKFDFVPWVSGYLEGVELAEPGWYESGDEAVVDELLFPLVVLAGGLEDDDDLQEALEAEGGDEEQLRRQCEEELPLAVQQAFDYWVQWRKPAPARRDEPKTGRNDPCPCGSGKKYKNCCGQ
ncbi:MAG: UPF0149 family protein [Betaproteobacteria bacterium]|nr:UPF0149 family protein [Betaproteobacteria bacterium]